MKKYTLVLLLILIAGCSAKESRRMTVTHTKNATMSYAKYQQFVLEHEAAATVEAQKVMRVIRGMVESREVIRGACWDYLNTGFSRAGYPQSKISKVYKSSKAGPYANATSIQIGDWLYFINHSYHGIEHSGMFIGWIDYGRKIGLTLSYAGENRREPARYKAYNLSSVYHIMRAE